MKYLSSAILIALFSFLLSLYMSWWSVAVVAFCVALWLMRKPFWSFITGFASIFLLWGGLIWFVSTANNHILAHRISLFVLKQDNPSLLVLLSAVSGAMVAGFAALSGTLFGRLLSKNKPLIQD